MTVSILTTSKQIIINFKFFFLFKDEYKRQRTNSEINVVVEDETENLISKLGESDDIYSQVSFVLNITN